MKKIAIVTLAVALEGEKGYSRFRSLAEMLSKKYAVDIITSSFQHWEKKQRDVDKLIRDNHDKPYRLKFAFEPGYKKNVDFTRIYSHKIAVKNIIKILKEEEYDLIYCVIPDNNMAASVGKYAHKQGIKNIVDIEDLWPEAMEMVSPLPKGVNKLVFSSFRRDAKKAYEYADAFVGTSDEYRDIPQNKYNVTGKPAITVYVGCDLNEFDSGVQEFIDKIEKKDGEFWVTYAGNLGSSYDIPTLIRTGQQIYNEYPNIKMKILGGGPLKEEFEKIADEKECNVDFIGYTPYKEMAAYLVKSDILVNSFVKRAPQSIVTKIGDYLAAGKPMVNTCSSSEFRKKVEIDGFGVNVYAEDVEALKNAIIKLSNDEKLCKKMGTRAREIAEVQFDRKCSYKLIINQIGKLLGE